MRTACPSRRILDSEEKWGDWVTTYSGLIHLDTPLFTNPFGFLLHRQSYHYAPPNIINTPSNLRFSSTLYSLPSFSLHGYLFSRWTWTWCMIDHRMPLRSPLPSPFSSLQSIQRVLADEAPYAAPWYILLTSLLFVEMRRGALVCNNPKSFLGACYKSFFTFDYRIAFAILDNLVCCFHLPTMDETEVRGEYGEHGREVED
ncbi:hypothetical protein FB446DRAFT_199310 [Lentinula raphanica]|nr:hypothetical protein FB446DRAFT_199310 [Lentinula raphanica]